MSRKRCSKCKQNKPTHSFSNRQLHKSKNQRACKSCISKQTNTRSRNTYISSTTNGAQKLSNGKIKNCLLKGNEENTQKLLTQYLRDQQQKLVLNIPECIAPIVFQFLYELRQIFVSVMSGYTDYFQWSEHRKRFQVLRNDIFESLRIKIANMCSFKNPTGKKNIIETLLNPSEMHIYIEKVATNTGRKAIWKMQRQFYSNKQSEISFNDNVYDTIKAKERQSKQNCIWFVGDEPWDINDSGSTHDSMPTLIDD
eukprot:250607_1